MFWSHALGLQASTSSYIYISIEMLDQKALEDLKIMIFTHNWKDQITKNVGI